MATGWADISCALSGFYEIVDVLIVLDEVLCLEVSNLARQLKIKQEINEEHHVVNNLTTSLWIQNLELTIVGSTSSSRRPIHDRLVDAVKQLDSIVYRLTEERKRWPFLAP